MSYNDFKKIIEEVGDYLIFVALWNYGEPLLNPDIAKMIGYCSSKGLITILSTNGNLLTPGKSLELFTAGLKYLIIGIDGVSEDTYQRYRSAGKLSEIEYNVREAHNLKKANEFKFPIIDLQFIVMKDNERQAESFFPLARAWGAERASLKRFIMFKDTGFRDEFVPQNENYVLDCYKKGNSIYKNFCPTPWQALVIDSNGWVVPCCSDYFSKKNMGDAFRQDLKKIWNNNIYMAFRREIKNNINSIDICSNCCNNSGQSGSFISVRQFK
jgi:radical SAM protein with 4Fe4S-binding SPASM domain